VRVHNIDAREKYDEDMPMGFGKATNEIHRIYRRLSNLRQLVDSSPDSHMIFKGFVAKGFYFDQEQSEIMTAIRDAPSIEDLARLAWSLIVEVPDISKELKRGIIPPDVIRDAYIELLQSLPYVQKEFRETREEEKRKVRRLPINYGGLQPQYNFLAYKDLLLSLAGTFVDVYTISRMFKVFRPGRRPVEQPPEQRNIIVYVGGAHAHNLRFFMRYFGFNETHLAGIRDSVADLDVLPRCLDVRNVPVI